MVNAGDGIALPVSFGAGKRGSTLEPRRQEIPVASGCLETDALFLDENRRSAADPMDPVDLSRIAKIGV
jgi:hypothetical protein